MVKFTQVIGDEKKTLNLCKSCADKEGLNNPLVDISKVFGKILIDILSEHLSSKAAGTVTKKDRELVCDGCGLSWADFMTSGRLGCPQCYESFLGKMKVLLRRLHGCNQHIGKQLQTTRGEQVESVDALRQKLRKAVEREEYEAAAALRDRIKERERRK